MAKIKRMARFGTLKSDKMLGIVGNYSDDCNYYIFFDQIILFIEFSFLG